jgi:hypothetical protein
MAEGGGIAAVSRRELVAIDAAGLRRILVEFVARLLVRGNGNDREWG